MVARLLANKVIGREDNWSKDNSLSGQLVKRIYIGQKENWSKDMYALVSLCQGLRLRFRFRFKLKLRLRLKA